MPAYLSVSPSPAFLSICLSVSYLPICLSVPAYLTYNKHSGLPFSHTNFLKRNYVMPTLPTFLSSPIKPNRTVKNLPAFTPLYLPFYLPTLHPAFLPPLPSCRKRPYILPLRTHHPALPCRQTSLLVTCLYLHPVFHTNRPCLILTAYPAYLPLSLPFPADIPADPKRAYLPVYLPTCRPTYLPPYPNDLISICI